jgi:hypothetical protein
MLDGRTHDIRRVGYMSGRRSMHDLYAMYFDLPAPQGGGGFQTAIVEREAIPSRLTNNTVSRRAHAMGTLLNFV